MSIRAGLIGAGGHARALVTAAQAAGWTLCLYCDPNPSGWCTLPHVPDETTLIPEACPSLILGFGAVTPQGLGRRLSVQMGLSSRGFSFPALVHPSAAVDATATLGIGAQILACSVVQPGADVGFGAIVNSGSIVEHDCRIGAGAHIAPGAIILGGARIGARAMIGAGAVVLPGAAVPDDGFVPALTRHSGRDQA